MEPALTPSFAGHGDNDGPSKKRRKLSRQEIENAQNGCLQGDDRHRNHKSMKSILKQRKTTSIVYLTSPSLSPLLASSPSSPSLLLST